MRTPVAVHRASERHAFETMIREHLVKPHGEKLRSADCHEAPGGEVLEILALCQHERVAEPQRHAHRRHGMVVPGGIADEHALWGPVADTRSELVRRRMKLSRPECGKKPGPQRSRQKSGVGVGEQADPVAGRPMIERDIDDDSGAVFAKGINENRARASKQYLPESLRFDARAFDRYADHPRTYHPLCRHPEGAAYDRGPAVGADNPSGGQTFLDTVAGEDDPLVFDVRDSRVEMQFDVRLVLDGFMQPRHERVMLEYETAG